MEPFFLHKHVIFHFFAINFIKVIFLVNAIFNMSQAFKHNSFDEIDSLTIFPDRTDLL